MDKLGITDKIDDISMDLSAMHYMFDRIIDSTILSNCDMAVFNGLIRFLDKSFENTIKTLDTLSETLLSEVKTEQPGREKECGPSILEAMP